MAAANQSSGVPRRRRRRGISDGIRNAVIALPEDNLGRPRAPCRRSGLARRKNHNGFIVRKSATTIRVLQQGKRGSIGPRFRIVMGDRIGALTRAARGRNPLLGRPCEFRLRAEAATFFPTMGRIAAACMRFAWIPRRLELNWDRKKVQPSRRNERTGKRAEDKGLAAADWNPPANASKEPN